MLGPSAMEDWLPYSSYTHTSKPSSTAELSVHARFTVVASIAATVRPVGPAGGVVQALFEGGDSPTLLYAIA